MGRKLEVARDLGRVVLDAWIWMRGREGPGRIGTRSSRAIWRTSSTGMRRTGEFFAGKIVRWANDKYVDSVVKEYWGKRELEEKNAGERAQAGVLGEK